MAVIGPAFYDADDWEPDGPDRWDVLMMAGARGRGRRLVMTPAMEHMLLTYFKDMGERGVQAMQAFFDEFQPVATRMNEFLHKAAPMIEAVQHKPPKTGPQFNPHARHGKGGRRR